MTYCLGIINQFGIVMARNSRTNAGVDHISSYKKLFDLSLPGERVVVICASDSLLVTQGAIARLSRFTAL